MIKNDKNIGQKGRKKKEKQRRQKNKAARTVIQTSMLNT